MSETILNSITDLQAVDFALGKVISDCFKALNPEAGPRALRRFLIRPDAEKIYLVKNDDVQTAMRKIAKFEDDPGHSGGDLPAILYYREHGITGDMNQRAQVAEVTRFIEEKTIMDHDNAMRVTTIPLTLTYSMLLLAWDRATIEQMAIAWWARTAPIMNKHYRFMVPYTIDGESFEVAAKVNTPRETLTSYEQIDDRRLWGSRTMVEVNTQAVYGAKVERQDYLTVVGDWRVIHENGSPVSIKD